MKKAAIYIRVSTTEQFEHGFSVDEQRERLISYCKAMAWEVIGIYVDGGYSGSNTDRPGLQKMISEIKLIDVVVVYKLDRLSRSQKDTLSLVEDVFLKNNIDFVSLQEKLDTTTPTGRMMIGILSAFAQLERETFKERSILGRTGRARKGKWVGSGRPPIGYDYNPAEERLTINEHEAAQVREVFDLYLKGTGLIRIAEIMHKKGYKHKYGDWTFWGGVMTMLKNPVYIGKVTFDGKEFDGDHEPIIDIDTFNQVQKMVASRSTGKLYKRHSPFSHLMYCANCRAKVTYLNKKNREPKYYCYSRYGNKHNKITDPDCKMKIWSAHLVEKTVLDAIAELAKSKCKITEQLGATRRPKKTGLQELEKKVADVDKQIDKLMELYQISDMPADLLNTRIRGLYNEKKSIMAAIDAIEEEKCAEVHTIQVIQSAAKEIAANWNDMEILRQIELLNVLISKIDIDHENIRIHWRHGALSGE